METAVQEIWTASSGEIVWNAPSPLVVDEISRAKAVGPSVEKQKKGLRGTVWRRGVRLAVSETDDEGSCSPGSSRVPPEQDRRVRCLETRTPQTRCCRAVE